ncbi:unnamed protein product, partial [Darwinula stevensoni]
RACGRIIGRGGETIRDIRKQCRADISIQKDDKQDGHTEILLRGTLEQIAMAKDLIREKVEEAEAFSEKISKKSDEKNLASSEEALGMHHAIEAASSARVSSETGETVELVPAGGDGFMGLLVSAVEDAGHFWVQVHGPNAIALEKLTDDMCAFYGDSENQQKYTLDKVTIDDLVAAKFMDEDRYYRCRVTGITENEYSPQESRLDLMFLDYGDSCSVKKNEAFCLAVHFQELQFQAVECCLAKVSPRVLKGGWMALLPLQRITASLVLSRLLADYELHFIVASAVVEGRHMASKPSREAVIYMFQQGHSPVKIIKELKMPRSTVYKAIAHYKGLGTTQDQPRSGHPSESGASRETGSSARPPSGPVGVESISIEVTSPEGEISPLKLNRAEQEKHGAGKALQVARSKNLRVDIQKARRGPFSERALCSAASATSFSVDAPIPEAQDDEESASENDPLIASRGVPAYVRRAVL